MKKSNVEEAHGIWQFCARSFENIQESLSEFENGTACIQIRRDITQKRDGFGYVRVLDNRFSTSIFI
jgi:uncharacterized membrane-anchored protein